MTHFNKNDFFSFVLYIMNIYRRSVQELLSNSTNAEIKNELSREERSPRSGNWRYVYDFKYLHKALVSAGSVKTKEFFLNELLRRGEESPDKVDNLVKKKICQFKKIIYTLGCHFQLIGEAKTPEQLKQAERKMKDIQARMQNNDNLRKQLKKYKDYRTTIAFLYEEIAKLAKYKQHEIQVNRGCGELCELYNNNRNQNTSKSIGNQRNNTDRVSARTLIKVLHYDVQVPGSAVFIYGNSNNRFEPIPLANRVKYLVMSSKKSLMKIALQYAHARCLLLNDTIITNTVVPVVHKGRLAINVMKMLTRKNAAPREGKPAIQFKLRGNYTNHDHSHPNVKSRQIFGPIPRKG